MTATLQFNLNVDARLGLQHVLVEIVADELLLPDRADFIVQQWRSIARAFDCGLLTDPTVPPARAFGVLVSHAPIAPQGLALEVHVCGAGPASWKVAMQLMQAVSDCTVAIATVSIAAIPATRSMDVGSVLAGGYPPARTASFPVSRAEGDAQRNRRIGLQFAGQLDAASRGSVEEAFGSWMDLANGGFPRPGTQPADNACDATGVDWVADAMLECLIPNYLGDEAAFDAVVNMAVVLDAKVARVAALEIG